MESDPWFEDQYIDCVDMEGYALAYVAQQYLFLELGNILVIWLMKMPHRNGKRM